MSQTTDARATAPVDTRGVSGRRNLRFMSIDEVLADVDVLAAAERERRLRGLGNWTLGQALGHLATWVNFAYDGTPLQVPLLIRLLSRIGKNRFLYGQLRAGVKIPHVEGGTLGTERLELDEGLARYRAALERLRRETPTAPNSIFGKLSHDEWTALQLRHAELHLSFFVQD